MEKEIRRIKKSELKTIVVCAEGKNVDHWISILRSTFRKNKK